jgi:polyisoprenoid-binding protein YceI
MISPAARIVTASLLALAIALSLMAQTESTSKRAETFAVDAVHSSALFRVQHLGVANFYGRFNEINGIFTFNEEDATGLTFDLTIPADSIDSNSEQRDNHLKSPDFFNAREFKTLTFKSASARKVDDKAYEVTGDLTMLGVTRPLTAVVHWTGSASSRGKHRCGLETTFSIKRSDFGMDYGVEAGMLGDEVGIIIALEGVKK